MQAMDIQSVTILSVTFGDRWIELTWNDAVDASARSMQIHQDLIDPNLVPDQLGEVMESLKEMLEVAAVERRDPPREFSK